MASDLPGNRSASASSRLTSLEPRGRPRRPWPSVVRGALFGLVLGLVPAAVAPVPLLAALAVPGVGIGAWVGWRLSASDRALVRVREAAKLRERELLGRAWYARSMLQNAFDAVLVVGSDNRVMDANRKVERLFGLSLDAMSGAPLTDLLPELPAAPQARTIAAHADGSTFDVDVQTTHLANDRSPDLPWGRVRVVSVREARRTPVPARVLREVVDRQRGQQVAEQRRRGQVLSLIGGALQSQVDRLRGRPELADVDLADAVEEQIELLATLAMWERSAADPTLGPVDLPALVEDAASDAAEVARRRGVAVAVRAADGVGEVVTDAMLLRGAVRTLILLAVRANRDTTVRVEVLREAGRGTDWVTVLVDDEGRSPLSTAARDAIQSAFEASEETAPPTDARAGVALARRLARTLGGHVAIGIDPALGTCLSLRVPVDPSKVRSAVRAPEIRPTA